MLFKAKGLQQIGQVHCIGTCCVTMARIKIATYYSIVSLGWTEAISNTFPTSCSSGSPRKAFGNYDARSAASKGVPQNNTNASLT